MGRNAKFYKKTKLQGKASSKTTAYDDEDDDERAETQGVESLRRNARRVDRGRDLQAANEKDVAKARQQLKSSTRSARAGPSSQRDVLLQSASRKQAPVSEAGTELSAQHRASSGTPKLKSRLWKNLEAQRAAKGQGEIATPRDVGIDYLSQWEKRRR